MTGSAPLLVGQSLELWRPPLSDALRRRDPGPLIARARRQLEAARAAGLARVALDVNLGLGEDVAPARLANDLVWAASAVRGAAPGVAIWLDCGSHEALTIAAAEIPPPVTVNAVFLDRPGARDLLAVAAEAGAGVVVSPADRADADLDGLLRAAAHARELLAESGLAEAWFDCLAAPPPAPPHARPGRALELVRALAAAEEAPRLRPLLAAGNVGYVADAPPSLRDALRALYAAVACGAGVEALIGPLEQPSLLAAAACGGPPPGDPAARWLQEAARAAARGQPPPRPHASLAAAHADLDRAWSLLFE